MSWDESDGDWRWIKCDFCNGTGKVLKQTKCPKCDGTGELMKDEVGGTRDW